MTLRDLFDVTWTITRVELTARGADQHFLHQFWIGENCDREHLPPGMIREWEKDRLTLAPRKINVHGETGGKSLPEIGWGLKNKTIPKELLDAEIVHLGMRCANGITYTVYADIILSELQCEMLKKELET